MPQDDRFGTGQLEGVDRVAVAVAAREDDDTDADRHGQPSPAPAPTADDAAPSGSMANTSISGFDSSSVASRSTIGRAARLVVGLDGQLDPPPDADVVDPLDPEMAERPLDGPTGRIEDAGLGRDVDRVPEAGHEAMTSSSR